MKGTFRKIDDKTVIAVDARAMEALAGVHRGADCIGDIRGARNVQQHKLFWGLMGLVAEQTDSSKDAVKEWLMQRLNYVDLLWLPDGSMARKAKSIAFESMEQAEFAVLFRLAIPAIATLLEAAPKEILDRFNDMLDVDGKRHLKKIMERQ